MRFTFFPTSRRAERGQALLETTIFLPVFLLGMYGVFWSVKQGALSERVQLGVRYGGVVSTLANPYDSYSLYALYATIDGHPPNGVVTPGSPSPCFRPDPSEVNSGRSSFWAPGALTPAAGSCIGGVETVSGPEAFTQPVLIQANFDAITAQAPVEGYLAAGAFGGQTGASQQVAAQQNFFRSPDVGTALQCANGGIFIKESLEPAYDSSVPNPATPLPLLVTPVTIFNAGNTCATFSPAPSAAPATPPPTGPTSPPPTGGCGGGSTPCPGGSGQTSVPTTAPSSSAAPTSTPTAKPTVSPSPVPTATPTPTPTPIPKPTPTPVPTATPTPTAKPTATPTPKPTPTPTAKPTATPIPTATPKPTATPTPTPTPSPTPKPTASPTPTAKPTASPTPTASPVPTPTKSPTPSPSPTPVPTPTPTTKPTSAPTFTPSPTPTPVATAKPTATPVSGPTPPPGGGF